MRSRSIGFRLTVWYAAVLTAGLGLFGALIWFSLRQRLTGEVDRELEGRASQFERFFRTEAAEAAGADAQLKDELGEFCQALPSAGYLSVSGASGFVFRFPSEAPAATRDFRILRRQFTFDSEVFDLQIGAPMGSVVHTLDLLRLLLFSLIPVVIAIACVGGAWMSGRALKPIRDITAAAGAIGIENLSGRLPSPATDDEIARLTEVLNGMLGRLESAIKGLSQFVANASHEIRTPLAVVRTTAELALRRARAPDAYRDSLRQIAGETERMTQLVEDLLILARSDTGTAEMPLAPVDVREIAADVCAEMRGLADLRRIRLQVSPGDMPAVISGNRPALHRLLLVLLDNALKYSSAGSHATVTVRREASLIFVEVADFGTGISQADLPHIFERFYRADRARSGGGYGLGLSLAESIAKAHGATIGVRSLEGAGSTFQVRFVSRDARLELANPAARAGAVAPLV